MVMREGVLGILCLLASAAAVSAATVDVDEVRAALDAEPWVTIADREHVKLGADAWRGPADLSFRYRLRAAAGALWLQVDVTDDRPGVFGKGAVVSDHVELWVADAALVRSYAERTDAIRKTIADFTERVGDGDCDADERGFIKQEQALLKKLAGDRYYSQFSFRPQQYREERAPGEQVPGVGGATYAADPHATGYEVFVRLPLFGACDFKDRRVDGLAVLVDVVDVDDAGSTKQKTLLSSSAHRRYADPRTFDAVSVAEPWELPVSVCARESAKAFDVDGFWQRRAAGYEFVAWGQEAWSGCTGVDRAALPGYWQRPLEPIGIPPDFIMQLVPNGDTFLLVDGERCAAVKAGSEGYAPPPDGSEWLPYFATRAGEFVYLLLEGRRYSHWPPGMTQCGAGVEGELVWLKLDRALAVVARDAVTIESCFDDVIPEVHRLGSHVLVVETSATKDGAPSRTRITYDDRRPAEGLVKQELAPKPQ